MTLPPAVWDAIRHGVAPSEDSIAEVVGRDGALLGATGAARLRADLSRDVLGLGPLESLAADPRVTDIAVNGSGTVWLDRGDGMVTASIRLSGPEEVRRLAVRLAGLAGRRLDDASPYVDGQLPSGIRLHAVIPPLVAEGAHVTLRLPARVALRLEDLVSRGMLDRGAATVLRRMVRGGVSFLISGGTGSGKTTLLAALLAELPPGLRIVVVEDVRELALPHCHAVRLQARSPNVEGAGEVTMTTLVRQALRMRPDRLVVGEVRGAEVRELLTALNTGHEGGAGTVHANAVDDVLARLEALGALAGMGPEAVRTQSASALQAVVHLRRVEGVRRLAEIGVMTRSGDRPGIVTAYRWAGGTLERAEGAPVFDDLLGRVAP